MYSLYLREIFELCIFLSETDFVINAKTLISPSVVSPKFFIYTSTPFFPNTLATKSSIVHSSSLGTWLRIQFMRGSSFRFQGENGDKEREQNWPGRIRSKREQTALKELISLWKWVVWENQWHEGTITKNHPREAVPCKVYLIS